MEDTALSFEQILNTTVRMVCASFKASVCLFLQTDDDGNLHLRASHGLTDPASLQLTVKPAEMIVAQCMNQNEVVQHDASAIPNGLGKLLSHFAKPGEKFVMVPVSGQTRVLGVLILGPFSQGQEIMSREAELRSAGALCAVLSAHWRLYEWMSHFLPEVNHELRTPLTAVQGSLGMVLGGVFGQVGGEVRAMLEMAHKGCERTVRAIEDYLINQKPPK